MAISECDKLKIQALGNRELVKHLIRCSELLQQYSFDTVERDTEKIYKLCDYQDALKEEILRRLETDSDVKVVKIDRL